MAETVHLYLKANSKDIKGESSQESLGRKDSIEIVSYDQGVKTAREAGTGMMTGRRQYDPLKITTRIGKHSPLIMKALTQNERIDAVFKFFRPNPTGDGTTEQFFTVEIKNGNVASVRDEVLNTLDPELVHRPPLQEITFVFQDISWTYSNGGITHTDTWRGNK